MPADVAAMASAIAALFHPYVEVAAHDVSSDRLVAIWNAFTSRRPGEVSLLDPELLADAPEGHVYGPYDQVDSRGRCLSSVGIRLDGGRLVLCLNVDRSAIDSVMTFLSVTGDMAFHQATRRGRGLRVTAPHVDPCGRSGGGWVWLRREARHAVGPPDG